LDFLERHVRGPEFTLLDLGTGSGDIPAAIARWAAARGIRAEITAIDVNRGCLDYARRRFSAPGVLHVEHSAFDLESLGEFDFITASMFFHHLSDERIVELLRRMAEQARVGFLVNDLWRDWLPYAGVAALSALTLNSVVFHDAKLSVLRGFAPRDAERYRELSGLDALEIRRRPVGRVALSYARGAN